MHGESTTRPRKATFAGRSVSEMKVSTTPTSEMAAIMRWRRDPRRKCCGGDGVGGVRERRVIGDQCEKLGGERKKKKNLIFFILSDVKNFIIS